jgi:hypothetical protein
MWPLLVRTATRCQHWLAADRAPRSASDDRGGVCTSMTDIRLPGSSRSDDRSPARRGQAHSRTGTSTHRRHGFRLTVDRTDGTPEGPFVLSVLSSAVLGRGHSDVDPRTAQGCTGPRTRIPPGTLRTRPPPRPSTSARPPLSPGGPGPPCRRLLTRPAPVWPAGPARQILDRTDIGNPVVRQRTRSHSPS